MTCAERDSEAGGRGYGMLRGGSVGSLFASPATPRRFSARV
jgi:hypothetical protein